VALKASPLVLLCCAALLWAGPVRAEAAGLDPALEAAIATYREDGPAEALPVFQRLAQSFDAQGKARDAAAAVHFLGECEWRLGRFDEARAHLEQALKRHADLGDRIAIGKTLNVLGLLEWDLGRYEQATGNFERAGTIARKVGDRRLEGATLNNLSLVYDELGDYQTSLKQYQRVLEIYRDADFPRGVGDTLGNIGGVCLLLGRYEEAIDHYRQALAISQQLDSTTSMSQDHGNIGLGLLGLGQLPEALREFDRAIELASKAGMRQDQAFWLRNKGGALVQAGRYDEGFALYRQALAIYDEVEAPAERAAALHDAGHLHLLLGDTDTAERLFREALAAARRIDLSRGVTLNLLALGDLHQRVGNLDEAAALFAEARDRARAADEQPLLARSLLRLASVHRGQDRLEPAASEAAEALEISRRMGSRLLEAEALLVRADVTRLEGRARPALEDLAAAKAVAEQVGDPELLWQAHLGRAKAQEALGDKAAAVESLLAAVTVIEGVRSRLQEQRYRTGYLQDKYEVYTELVRLQLELGRTEDAFSSAERLRARNYAEQLDGRIAVPLSDEERRTETRLRARIRQLQRALGEEGADSRPAGSTRAVETFSAELQEAERQYQTFLVERIPAVSAAAGPVGSLPASALRDRLGRDEALIEYVVAPDRITAFVVTSRGLQATTQRIRSVDLAARIELLRDLLRRPGDDRWQKPATSLAATLLHPLVADGALKGVRQVYVVPHGVLNYLPFSLLPLQDGPADALAIDRYSIAYLPAAAALLATARPAAAERSVLAVAPSRSRLRYAPTEARAVDALFRPNSRLLVGSDATEQRVKALAGEFSLLHLATHGQFNKYSPLLSGLELEASETEDGLLQVHEVLGLRLRSDLVTLSACDTALGSGYFAEVPAGDEFVGLTRAFLSAGSAAVLATLWEVDDRSSVTLMRRFYEQVSTGAEPDKARALNAAQRALRSSSDLGHPYYWAPFIFVGHSEAGDVQVASR